MRNFNQGIGARRPRYTRLVRLAVASIAITVLIFAVILYREFFSAACHVIARLKMD